MRFVFVGSGGARDLEARFDSPEPTIGDLISGLTASRLTHGGEPGLFVNGMFQAAGVDVIDAGLHDGAVISAGDARAAFVPAASPLTPGPHLGVLTGMAAGRSFPLTTAGVYLVGRSADCHLRIPDPTVSRVHCELHVGDSGAVMVVNRSRTDGTRIGGEAISDPMPVPPGLPIRLGAVVVQIDDVNLADRAEGRGGRDAALGETASGNRPPRVVQFPPNTTLIAPAEPWESRHRAARRWRRPAREFNRQVGTFATTSGDAWRAEVAGRRRLVPTAPEVVRRATRPSVSLWERRRVHSDFLHLSLGWQDATWTPKLVVPASTRPPATAVLEVVAARQVLPDVPAILDLSAGHVVGVVGPRPLALGVARHLMCQAAVLHAPADVRLGVLVSDDYDIPWDWTKWLPHVQDRTAGAERLLLAAGAAAVADLLGRVRADTPAAATGRPRAAHSQGGEEATTLYVIDGAELLNGRNAPARLLLTGVGGPAAGIVLASAADRLPTVCSDIVTLTDAGEAHLVRSGQGGAGTLIRPAALPPDLARTVALALAAWAESPYVVGIPDSAEISPREGGYIGGGKGEGWPGQAAWSTGPIDQADDRPGALVMPFTFGATGPSLEGRAPGSPS